MRLSPYLLLSQLIFAIGLVPPALAGVTADLTYRDYVPAREEVISQGKYLYDDHKVLVELNSSQEKKYPEPPPSERSSSKNKAQKAPSPQPPKITRHTNKKSFMIDHQKGKANYMIHEKQRYMPLDLNLPRGWEEQFWVRFLKQGGVPFDRTVFEKRKFTVKYLKDEKVEGHICQVWNMQRAYSGQKQTVTLWAAKNLDNIPLKINVKGENGSLSEFRLSNIRKTEVDLAAFQPPKGYKVYEPKILEGGMPDQNAALKQRLAAKPQKGQNASTAPEKPAAKNSTP